MKRIFATIGILCSIGLSANAAVGLSNQTEDLSRMSDQSGQVREPIFVIAPAQSEEFSSDCPPPGSYGYGTVYGVPAAQCYAMGGYPSGFGGSCTIRSYMYPGGS